MELTPEILKKEAERLLKDPVLIQAALETQKNAVDHLTQADAGNPTEILKWQAMHRQAYAVMDTLDNYVQAIPDEDDEE